MNETINLPRLISLIAEKAGVQPAVARRFLHDFFAQIERGLAEGESVQIKGIGEFVKSDDPANPILYKADDELAAIANEPFAAFEAVELNDGAIDEINTVATPTTEPQPTPIVEMVQESQHEPEPEPQPETESENVADPEPADEHEEDLKPDEPAEDDKSETADSGLPKPVEAPIIEPESEPEPESEATPGPAPDSDPEPEKEVVKEIVYVDRPAAGGGHGLWFTLGILVGILVGLVGGYFAGKTMAAFDLPEEDEDEDYADSTEFVLGDTPDASEALPSLAAAADTAVSTTPAPVPVQEEVKTTAAPEPKAEKKAEPVYDEVTQRRFLTQIARDHYGVKNYWVFIYAANKNLGNPNRIGPGTRVLVPDKSTFMEATREATDAKASRMIAELEKKYK